MQTLFRRSLATRNSVFQSLVTFKPCFRQVRYLSDDKNNQEYKETKINCTLHDLKVVSKKDILILNWNRQFEIKKELEDAYISNTFSNVFITLSVLPLLCGGPFCFMSCPFALIMLPIGIIKKIYVHFKIKHYKELIEQKDNKPEL